MLGFLRPPHRSDLVATERQGDLRILGDNPRQRHGEIVSQRHVAPTLVLKAIQQVVFLPTVFADEDVEVLQCRRHQRHEPEARKDPLDLLEHLLARNHLRREIVPKPFEDPGLDASLVVHVEALSSQPSDIRVSTNAEVVADALADLLPETWRHDWRLEGLVKKRGV